MSCESQQCSHGAQAQGWGRANFQKFFHDALLL
jgi:hypothetical protein